MKIINELIETARLLIILLNTENLLEDLIEPEY